MLYHNEKKKVQTNIDCLTCPYFNERERKCEGLGKVCFEYDPKTETCIDPITRLPIKLK